jgi:hypothetical protein
MDGRQSGCYAPDPGFPRRRKTPGGPGWFLGDGHRDEDAPLSTPVASHDRARPWRGWLALAAALTPALAAVWWYPGFMTQDGPAHLYNAHILVRSFDPASPFRDTFVVKWEPLPNWAGHVVTAALVAILPPRAVDRAMTTLTLVAFAAAVARLRTRVAGPLTPTAALLAALLALNVAWLFGFSSFLLGACLFPATLGAWWTGRDAGWSPRRAAGLAVLTVLGYFCHLVSLGLTVVGLAVLEAFTPARPGERAGRAATTAAGLIPLAPLGFVYLRLMRQGSGVAPEWKHLARPLSPGSWLAQLTWVDPISLARKDYLPIAGTVAGWHDALAPVLWLGLALGLAIVAAWRSGDCDHSRRGWWVLAALLVVGGTLGPDTLGPSHGEYLQQRVVLLGLVALVPVVRLDRTSRLGRLATVAMLVAIGLQSAVVWDYGAASERTAGTLIGASRVVGRNRRIATRLTLQPPPFRSNPLLHADCLLGVGTGNVLWSDYETRFYYFPVQFRPGLDHPDPAELEWIARTDDPDRARRWAALLERHDAAIDVVVAWGDDPVLDAITARRFPAIRFAGPVRVFDRLPAELSGLGLLRHSTIDGAEPDQ